VKKLKQKFYKLLETYSYEVSEANYPYSERANEYPELDDENFMLECFELDYAECFKFCSYRLRNKKDFVMLALKYAYPEYTDIGENLKNDFDILKKLKVKDFSKFGYKHLNDKQKIIEMIKESNSKDFFNHHWLPQTVKNDKNFFLKIIDKSYNSEKCLRWADDSLKKDFKFLDRCISQNPKTIKYISRNIQKFDKLVLKAIKKEGELLRYTGQKFLNNKQFILIASKSYGEIYKYIKKSLRNDYDILLRCILQDPQMLRLADKKIKKNKKIILRLIKKDFTSFKYIDKKLKLDYDILKSVILNLKFGSGDEYKSAAPYLSKLGNRNLIKLAIKKDGFWLDKLSEKYKKDKEIALLAVKNYYGHFSDISENLKKDNDVLEAATKCFLKGYTNFKTKKKEKNDINDLDRHHFIHKDLYWYIYYKVNPHKKNNKTVCVDGVRIRADGVFDHYDKVYFYGEMFNGRPHGKGYATNEESEWGDAAFPSTYEGEWLNGVPHGKGVFKSFAANNYPPNGKVDEVYTGKFINGFKKEN